MNRFLPTTLLWLALCMSAQAQPQCPQTPAPGTSNAMCASTAFVTKGLTNADAGNLTTGILPPGRTDGHMDGDLTGGSAAAGEVGEVVTGTVTGTSPLSLTSATPVSMTSITLSPGDWDVYSVVHFLPAATTNLTHIESSLSLTTNVPNPGTGGGGQFFSWQFPPFVPGAVEFSGRAVPSLQMLAVPTTFFLVVQATFTVSTLTVRGFIRARRMR